MSIVAASWSNDSESSRAITCEPLSDSSSSSASPAESRNSLSALSCGAAFLSASSRRSSETTLFVLGQFQRFDARAAAQIERLFFERQAAVRRGEVDAAVARAERHVAAFAGAARLFAGIGANFFFQGAVAGADVVVVFAEHQVVVHVHAADEPAFLAAGISPVPLPRGDS